jgi:hypothetical protein
MNRGYPHNKFQIGQAICRREGRSALSTAMTSEPKVHCARAGLQVYKNLPESGTSIYLSALPNQALTLNPKTQPPDSYTPKH